MSDKKKVVIIVETDFRDEEAIYPYYRLQEAGFAVEVATVGKKTAIGKFGVPIPGTVDAESLDASGYDAVVIPGGNEGPDRLRMNRDVLRFVSDMNSAGKVVAAICHGVWIPISAKIVAGRPATCYRAIVDDLVNAGGLYRDEPVVVDGNFITSRHPRDLAAFAKAVVDAVENRHAD
jgi:protease I